MHVSQAYDIYLIPQNLREHMLRVASLAEIILENWTGPGLDSRAIISACIFHDIAKPLSFDPDSQARFGMSPEGVVRLKEYQARMKSEYGVDEHNTAVRICREVGLSPAAVRLVDNLEWKYIPGLLRAGDLQSLIPIYCDMRVGPDGLLSLTDRFTELKRRTGADTPDDGLTHALETEKQIRDSTATDLDLITTGQLNSRMEFLLNQEI